MGPDLRGNRKDLNELLGGTVPAKTRYRQKKRRRALATLRCLAGCALLLAMALLLPGPSSAQASVSDLFEARSLGGINQWDLGGEANNHCCTVAAGTMIIRYYMSLSDLAAAKRFTIQDGNKYISYDPNHGTSPYEVAGDLEKAGGDPSLHIGGLTATLEPPTDAQHWFDVLKGELDQKRPIIVYLTDGEQLGWYWGTQPFYPHAIVVTGYGDNGSITYWDPWGGQRNTVSREKFESVWGYSPVGDPHPYVYWEVAPASETASAATGGTSSPKTNPAPSSPNKSGSPPGVLSAGAWTSLNPSNAPTPRVNASMVYDPATDRLILFGGRTSKAVGPGTDCNETWTYDFASNAWSQLSPSGSPPARESAALAYDPGTKRIILFGGFSEDALADLDDTWALDPENNTWTELNPSPSPSKRAFQLMIDDPQTGKLLGFGGDAGNWEVQTWAYDPKGNLWAEISPSGPPERIGAAMAYDSQSDQVILFGGTSANTMDDTWAYDVRANSWTKLKPPSSPPGRFGASMVLLPGPNQALLFGGTQGFGDVFGDTWLYDFGSTSWTELNLSSSPPGRTGQAMAYDPRAGQVVLFGGTTPDDDLFGDTWVCTPSATSSALHRAVGRVRSQQQTSQALNQRLP
jgi:N-acetylneuraminic acid mutarotase